MTIGDHTETTLWEGQSQTLTGAATGGRVSTKYRITPWHIYVESGLVTTNSQQIPLLSVRDVDVKATMTQKARGVGDVVVHGTDANSSLVITSVSDAKGVRDILNRAVHEVRANYQRQQTTQYHQGAVPTAQVSTAPADGGLVEQLTKLAALRDQGVLSEEEFLAQKAKLLA